MKRLSTLFLLTLLAVSIYAASNNSQQVNVRQTFSQSADISLSQITACRNIVISGQCQINHNGQTSLFRAILVDENGEEYLVAEFNDLISSEQQVSFNSRCDETTFSSSVKPAKLKIIVVNAQATIDNVTYDNNESSTRGSADIAAAKSTRIANEIALYNQAIQREGMLWIAGETSLSNLTYSQKKELFGATSDSCCWYGREYYKRGIYCTPNYFEKTGRTISSSQYAPNFTWQRRHGVNWNTSVKNQGQTNYCWAFAAAGLAEAYTNLYYNQKIDLDLSEQELISCCQNNIIQVETDMPTVFRYMRDSGVVNELSFQFYGSKVSCDLKDVNANKDFFCSLFYYDNRRFDIVNGINNLKYSLINQGPLCFGVKTRTNPVINPAINPKAKQPVNGHLMILVGYGVVQPGMIYLHNFDTIADMNSDVIEIDSTNQYIGHTYWIFKNSYGEDADNHGYLYAMINLPDLYTGHGFFIDAPIIDETNVYQLCQDLDEDGYYNWGLGPKPTFLSASDLPDGNDYNPNIGAMNNYGISELICDTSKNPYIRGVDTIGCSGKFAVMNIPETTEVTWTVLELNGNTSPIEIYGPNNEALVIVKQNDNNPLTGQAVVTADFIYNGTNMTLSKNISVTGSVTPFVNVNAQTVAQVGRRKVITETNCINIPDSFIKWDVNVPGVGPLTLYGHNIVVIPMSTGMISGTVTNLLACNESTSSFSFGFIVVNIHLGISKNPVDDSLEFIIYDSENDNNTNYNIDIYNSNGLRMNSVYRKNPNVTNTVDVSSYPNGSYTIRLVSDGNNIDVQNFIVKHK